MPPETIPIPRAWLKEMIEYLEYSVNVLNEGHTDDIIERIESAKSLLTK